jgi:hypothetical protein
MTSTQAPAYLLQMVKQDLGDLEHDADLVKFDGFEATSFDLTELLSLPDVIYFEAAFHVITQKDYILNDMLWPILSKKMLNVLISVGDFPHRAVPIIMLDDSVDSKNRFDEKGNPKPGVANEDYEALQLLTHLDVFDWEKSIYQESWISDKFVDDIEKLAIKEPLEGLPPIFRIASCFDNLFISHAAKEALEEARCQGYATVLSTEYDQFTPNIISKDN